MDELNFEKVCRICLGEGSMMSLFKVSMFKKMMSIASVQVWPNDGLPGQICARCASKLHIAFQLKKQCEKSDLKLRQYKAISPHKQLKVTDELQPSLNLGENGLPQQMDVQTIAQRVFVQENNGSLIENLKSQGTYNHFLTMSPNTEQLTQVAFSNLTNNSDGDLHVPSYNIQSHMIYNPQYNIHSEQMNPQGQLPQPEIIQLEVNVTPQLPEEAKDECSENIPKESLNNKEHLGSSGKACPTCGKVFRTNIKLNRHIKIHTALHNDLPYKCEVCGKGFSHGGNYKMHLRIHSNERPFKCPVCSKGCRQAQDLEKHLRTHTGERPHKCNFCPKAFATSSNLTAHIRIHTGERPYVCCACQKAFCQSSELTKHMRTHTGEKSHMCDICRKGFNGSSALLAHRRQHTGERPYACPDCDRSFTTSNCLTSHIKTHNKLYALKCGQCDQTFQSLSSLKDHLSSDHSLGEVIQCKMCDSSFDRVNDYVSHMRTHEDVCS